MTYRTIEKPKGGWGVPPNLPDYEKVCAGFSWGAARRELDGLPGGRGLNIAHEAIDRHAAGALRNHLALRWIGKRGETRDFSYSDLRLLTNRFANVLRRLGLSKGERVFLLAGRIPELYISALGTLKNRNVFCPLFSAFGPEPIRQRIGIGDGRVLVTTVALYKRKVADLRASLPGLRHVLLIGSPEEIHKIPDTQDFYQLMDEASDDFEIPPTDPEDLALLHFTSGTTGIPDGSRARSYGIIAPLTNGITSIIDEAEFDAERWYTLLQEQKVTNWYTAPTAVRMMMKIGTEVIRKYDLRHLRFIASVGEPLNPEAVVWGQEAFGLPIHDNWWQTETGGIMISNFAAMDIRPGSMGRPLPGIEAGIVHRLKDGGVEEIREAGAEGELALRPGWPSMFRGYLNEDERYRKCFAGGWYLTGDLARRDADGYFWFVGRADDVIKSSGHLIGPFEVESTLMEHPAVAEAGVIGKPDPMAGEIVKAFISPLPKR